MADANGLQRAIRHTGFFNIKKMGADFCSAQCIMDNSGSLTISLRSYMRYLKERFIRYPNTCKPVKKLGYASFFSTNFSALEILRKKKTLPRV